MLLVIIQIYNIIYNNLFIVISYNWHIKFLQITLNSNLKSYQAIKYLSYVIFFLK